MVSCLIKYRYNFTFVLLLNIFGAEQEQTESIYEQGNAPWVS
jgi:hypothetical protein